MAAAVTLNDALQVFAKLSLEDQEMMLEIAQRRCVEKWRKDVASYARKTRKDVAAGKLKPEPLQNALARLHRLADAK